MMLTWWRLYISITSLICLTCHTATSQGDGNEAQVHDEGGDARIDAQSARQERDREQISMHSLRVRQQGRHDFDGPLIECSRAGMAYMNVNLETGTGLHAGETPTLVVWERERLNKDVAFTASPDSVLDVYLYPDDAIAELSPGNRIYETQLRFPRTSYDSVWKLQFFEVVTDDEYFFTFDVDAMEKTEHFDSRIVVEGCGNDITAPTLVHVSFPHGRYVFLHPDPTKDYPSLTVKVTIRDDLTGLAFYTDSTLHGSTLRWTNRLVRVQPHDVYHHLTPSTVVADSYILSDGTLEEVLTFELFFHESTQPGVWSLSDVVLSDEMGNSRVLFKGLEGDILVYSDFNLTNEHLHPGDWWHKEQ